MEGETIFIVRMGNSPKTTQEMKDTTTPFNCRVSCPSLGLQPKPVQQDNAFTDHTASCGNATPTRKWHLLVVIHLWPFS